ncbi:serine/threonine-protein kinase [Inquilinus sp. Marseille-Q2685]|uniref:serine/threonine-protein kinase n=1 Tax=Inquilinus sp. Marseille-Q2685 TaxID=2866581 RepID=UPI00272A483F|nr:serine/threonine-protein kinase [Inquilinus sp. Marseille-Q2685]
MSAGPERRPEDPVSPAGAADREAQPPRTPRSAAELSPGETVLFTYRIVRLISRGGMGEIYEAEHIDQRTRHAIKIILPELMGDEAIVTLFLREADALRKIRHAAIVGYDGLFRDESRRLHLVMAYVDGPSLSERLRDGPLTPEEVAALRDRLASGLAEAHDLGICHRDLSPDNILLEHGRLGGAKLIDFGIAKLVDPDAQTVVGSAFAGKFSWASPEQVGLFGAQVDSRSDIYSLGLVLAAAARGRPLEMGRSMMAVVNARRSIPQLDGVPPSLAPQIARMLEPDPLDRPQSMRDLVGTAASAPGPAPSARTPRRRIATIAVVLCFVLAAAAGGLGWQWRTTAVPPSTPQPQQPTPSAAASGPAIETAPSEPARPEPVQPKPVQPEPAQPDSEAPAAAGAAIRVDPAPPLDRQQLPRLLDLPARDLYLAGRRFLLEKRDADTALVLWEEAARRGSGEAALGIARFYDPASWDQGPHPFTAPNPARAREFYSTALERGMEEARPRLQALGNAGSEP